MECFYSHVYWTNRILRAKTPLLEKLHKQGIYCGKSVDKALKIIIAINYNGIGDNCFTAHHGSDRTLGILIKKSTPAYNPRHTLEKV